MRNISEEFFQKFCQLRGIRWKRVSESDVSTPDYDIYVPRRKIVVEVKETTPNEEEKRAEAERKAAIEAAKREKEKARQRELAHAQEIAKEQSMRAEVEARSASRLRKLAAVLAVVSIVAIVSAVFAILSFIGQRRISRALVNTNNSLTISRNNEREQREKAQELSVRLDMILK